MNPRDYRAFCHPRRPHGHLWKSTQALSGVATNVRALVRVSRANREPQDEARQLARRALHGADEDQDDAVMALPLLIAAHLDVRGGHEWDPGTAPIVDRAESFRHGG